MMSAAQLDVAIIGLGYVGLPLCLAFARSGAAVLGVDLDREKTDALNAGKSYIKHLGDAAVAEARRRGFEATTDFSLIRQVEAILICVPTPLTGNRTPNLSFVENTARAIAPHLQPGQLVVLESTTYPGTTEEVLKPLLEAGSGLRAGQDFFLAYSPEREDPGNATKLSEIPKVVGGLTEACRDRAAALYGRIVKQVVPVSSCAPPKRRRSSKTFFGL